MLHLEEELIKEVLSGDINCFEHIVEQYKGLVFSICLNMVRDRFEAENLSQEIFLKAYHSLPSYKFKGFKSWISRIAVNRCIDYKRYKSSRCEEALIPPEILSGYCLESGPSVEELVMAREQESAVRQMCEGLPEIYGLVVKKYFLESKGVRRIAEEEGINYKTVETRLYRGLKLLRERWKEDFV